MTPKNLAVLLNGREYREEITPAEERQAKTHGLVVVLGASDDLMEFRGAIHDEVGAYEGGEFEIDGEGLIPAWENVDHDDINEMRVFFLREAQGKKLTALWDYDGYSWAYKTEIPHETFDISEDGEPYCRGVVFALADVSRP